MHNILFISSVTKIGGAELSMIEVVAHLDRSRFNPIVLTTEDGPLARRLQDMNIPVMYGSFPFFRRRYPWDYWKSIYSLVRLMRAKHIALVHVNCDRAVPHAVLAGKLAGVPVLCNVHDMVRAWFLPRYVRYMNLSARIVANSQATARHCLKAGMKGEKIQVIYECFEMDRYLSVSNDDREVLRNEWGLGKDILAVGLVGQVLKYKGHEEFIQAAAIVNEKYPLVYFFIVGDDSLSTESGFMQQLEESRQRCGLESNLVFTGFRDDIPQVMSALDIVVVPSHTEAFGRVVVEALALGKVVVATRVGGIPEIIEDGETGFLIQARDIYGLAEKISQLVKDRELRIQMGMKGPASVHRFDVKLTTRQFEETYLAILEGRIDTLPKVPFGDPTWM